GDLGDLTDSQKIVVFRVVQESLANVRKHSAASTASVSVCSTRRFVDVIVADNGRGFDRDRVTVGRLGLAGVSERARLLGGAVEIAGRVGIGTEVRVTLPRWQPSPDGVDHAPLRGSVLILCPERLVVVTEERREP